MCFYVLSTLCSAWGLLVAIMCTYSFKMYIVLYFSLIANCSRSKMPLYILCL